VPVTKKGRDECKRSKPIFSFLAYTMCPWRRKDVTNVKEASLSFRF
jgi:hypothetical protein